MGIYFKNPGLKPGANVEDASLRDYQILLSELKPDFKYFKYFKYSKYSKYSKYFYSLLYTLT